MAIPEFPNFLACAILPDSGHHFQRCSCVPHMRHLAAAETVLFIHSSLHQWFPFYTIQKWYSLSGLWFAMRVITMPSWKGCRQPHRLAELHAELLVINHTGLKDIPQGTEVDRCDYGVVGNEHLQLAATPNTLFAKRVARANVMSTLKLYLFTGKRKQASLINLVHYAPVWR